ncbi:MAG: NAD(P)H-dependent oxidoreductase [Chromatiales bacterium]
MTEAPRILVLFAHLAIQRSRINRAMVEAARGLPRLVFNDLLETYPDFYIDVERERALALDADLIVFQHPIYWYSAPAIIKHWQDVVLNRGFAYGAGGSALHGKDFMLAISTGGPPETYGPGGIHGRPLEEFLRPFDQMARFCGMNHLPPFVLQGGRLLPEDEVDAHARAYRALLEAYRPTRPEEA